MNIDNELKQHYVKADSLMLKICYGLLVYSFILAPWYSTWAEAIIVGGGSAAVLTLVFFLSAGTLISRIAFSSALMIFTALHIHQSQGMIEMHFGVFALLAVLLYYRDPIPIICAAAVIAVHHLAFFFLQANQANVWLLKSTDLGIWVVFLHAAYVVVETALLVWVAMSRQGEAAQSLEIKRATNSIVNQDHIDLTVRTSGHTELLERFNQFTAGIEDLAGQVKHRAVSVNNDGLSLREMVDKINHAIQTQETETEKLSGSISEMMVAIKNVSSHAETAAKATQEVDEHAAEATRVSENTRLAVKQLAEDVTEAQKTIEELNQHSSSIGSVLEVIRGVAEQTNLLALNAAIEAARAGEQGRGFAVVADEVRTLAQRTQQSTQEIDDLIETLQSGSEKAVASISSSQKQAEDCVTNTCSSLALMKQVSQAIRGVNEMNTSIASNAAEQYEVVEVVSQNIANIHDASTRSKEVSQTAAESSCNLQKISEELIQVTKSYRTSQ